MTDSKVEFLKDILNNRRNLIELIAVGILIGFGTEFLAGALYGHFNFQHKNLIFFILGTFFIVVGLLYFVYRFFGKKRFSKSLNGFFIFDRINKEIIDIDNYDFSDKLERYIKSALTEDQGLNKKWKNLDLKQRGWTEDYKELYKIINEASEYYLIEKLSTHLLTFFNNTEFDKNELVEYERNDISTLLLKNRFLELFSKPMEQRAAFIPDKPIAKQEKESYGKIISSYSNGAMFQHFDLRLPKDSKVIKNSDNSISIITKRFTLNLKSITSGVNTYIPWEYTKLYLGIDRANDNTSAYVVTFNAEIIFNFGALFKSLGWKYYNWLDTFLIKLEEDFGQRYYFDKKIQWDKSYPIIKSIIQNKEK